MTRQNYNDYGQGFSLVIKTHVFHIIDFFEFNSCFEPLTPASY